MKIENATEATKNNFKNLSNITKIKYVRSNAWRNKGNDINYIF